MDPGTTLLSYLRLSNPQIKLIRRTDLRAVSPSDVPDDANDPNVPKGKSKTHSRKHTKWPLLSDVRLWEDFEWDTLRRLFGTELEAALSTPTPQLQDFSQIHPSFCQINSEKCLDVLLSKYHRSVVLEALEQSPPALRLQDVYMLGGNQAVLLYDKTKKDTPDWVGTCRLQGIYSIIVGETKLSSVFVATDIPENDSRSTGRSANLQDLSELHPIRQLAHYCISAHCRYGYLITDKELIVVRVSSSSEPKPLRNSRGEIRKAARRGAIVEFRAISWNHDEDNEMLSINLALFILHLLAANNGQLDSHPYAPLENERLVPLEQQYRIRPGAPGDEEGEPESFEYQPSSCEPQSCEYQNSSFEPDFQGEYAPLEPDDSIHMDLDTTATGPSTPVSTRRSKTQKRIDTPSRRDRPKRSSRGISKGRRSTRSGTNSRNQSFTSMAG